VVLLKMPNYEPIDYRLRCHTKRTDLPADVLRDIGEAYAEIEQLQKERDKARLRTGRIFNEIDCRIEHGADSNGHLEAIRNLFKENTND
jgi:hypothetical protein